MNLSLEEFLRFMEYRKAASRTTLDTYRYNMESFLQFLGDKPLTLAEINRYADVLSLQGYKPKTFRNKLAIVRSFIRWLYITDQTEIKPEQVLVPPIQETEANFLDEEEVCRLLKVITDKRDRALIYVLLKSGVRVSELCNLRYEDMFDRSFIVRKGKGGKTRLVFINPEAKKILDKYIKIRGKQAGYLFPSCQGNHIKKVYVDKPLSRQLVHKKIKFYAEKAGIDKNISPHTLRHTMATSMLRNGARLEEVQQILGHSNIRTTMIYTHFTNQWLKDSYDKAMA